MFLIVTIDTFHAFASSPMVPETENQLKRSKENSSNTK